MRRAEVYNHDILSGVLEEDAPGHGYIFTYDNDYIAYIANDPISITMPLREESYKSEYLFPVFSNMLPEGANRKIVCRGWRLDENDYFSLLMKIATNDTIGALTVKEI